MSYVVPSVLVYQQLANAGGVANITPDLDAVIVGPCYNVLEYDGTSAAALTSTAALSDSGAAFSITSNTVNNTVNLPGQKPGQNVDEPSVEVYLNNVVVQSLSTKFTGSAGVSTATVRTGTATANAVASSAVLTTISDISLFAEGDTVSVDGAGAGGSALSAEILSIDTVAGTITLSAAVVTSVLSAVVTKGVVSNTNASTATKHVEPGDTVAITYKVGPDTMTFTTTVTEVDTLAGVLVSIDLSDVLPADITASFLLSVRKKFNNQLLVKTLDGYTNYSDSSVGADGKVTILPKPRLPYGTVITGDVHIAYRALRTDLIGAIQDIENVQDLEGKLGAVSDRNPLALGVQVALANTVGRILAVAIPSEDLAGYLTALDLLEGRRVYSLTPLTQSVEVLTAFQQHVEQMSTPEMAAWRMTVVSPAIPTTQNIGQWNVNNVNANGGNNVITLVTGRYILTASNAAFLSDGTVPGDLVKITAASAPAQVGSWKVLQVINNQQVEISATGVATGVSFYVTRTLTKAQQAAAVAGTASSFKSNRVMVVPQGAGITVDGVVKYLPGYYLACAISGLISGLPVQQSLTNIGLAGVADIQYGNFYFTRAQLATMAAAGVCLIVQETQGSIPYIRHSLTTDMTVLYFREVQQVKNWDYLSYFFYDILKGFIGKYNITPDTLRILGQTITAGGRLLQGKKLPKLGAPLLDFKIKTLKQDESNKDTVICELPVSMPVVMNYLNLYLIV